LLGEEHTLHVVVVGCGRVGSGLARILEDTGHSVAVIDKNAKAFRRLPEGFSGKTIQGVGFDRDLLRQAGIEEAGALAAVTSGDNSNIMVARTAREVFGLERVIARIYDPRRAAIYERLGIPTIATVQWTTDRVLRRILPDAPATEWTDPSAGVVLVERPVAASWAGRRLSELDVPGLARVAALSRLGVGQVPSEDLVTQEGDVVYMSVGADRIAELDAHLSSTSTGGHHS
jgi:trk system potassium uptake protein TrkA